MYVPLVPAPLEPLHALLALLVVYLPLVPVREHLVGPVDLLEETRGFLAPRVLVRVVLQRELAEGSLDIGF